MIDQFSKEEFEQALSDILSSKGNNLKVVPLGLVQGEYEYRVPLPPNELVNLSIRSSVDNSGYAAESGADSIRVWLSNSKTGDAIGSKVQSWVTRVPGWQQRLGDVMRELAKRRAQTGDCCQCGTPIHIYEVKKKDSPYLGQLFGKCPTCDRWWGWLNGNKPKAYFKEVNHHGKTDSTSSGSTKDVPRSNQPQPDTKGQVSSHQRQERERDRDIPSSRLRDHTLVGEHRVSDRGKGDSRDRGRSNLPALPWSDEGGGLEFLASEQATLVLEDEPVIVLPESEELNIIEVSDCPPTEEQLAAITASLDKAVRVLAGPGSGKTKLLVDRYQYLLEHGVDPQSILAVTFTDAMATSLAQRILAKNPEAERGVDNICTIHAACYRMLKAEGDKRSVPKRWKVKKAIEDALDMVWPGDLERPGYKDVLTYINSAKATGLQVGDDQSFYSERAGARIGKLITAMRRLSDEDLKHQKHLTFADMLLDVETKLKFDAGFRNRWQAKYQYVIIDEGQDTSRQAMKILTMLAAPQNRLFIVGDSDQLLFRFAGSTPEANLFNGFEKRYPDGDLYKLTVNWRSTKAIVKAQLDLIRHNYQSLGGSYDEKYVKELVARADASEGEPISFQWYGTPEEEALSVASGILEDMTQGYKPSDFFVASRTRAQLAYIEGALTRAGVPTINLCGGSFWTLKHVQDIIGYVRLACNKNDNAAFQQVYNIASTYMQYPWGEKKGQYCPHRFLGRAFLEACNSSYRGIWEASQKRNSFRPGVDDLTWFIDSLKEIIKTGTVTEAIEYILSHCYLDYLKAEEGVNIGDEAEDGKLSDLQTVKDIASDFGPDFSKFLAYVQEMIDAASRAKEKDWSQHVVLSTVHRLKGLERRVVYGIGWQEGIDNLGLPCGLLPHTFSLRPPPQLGILPTGGMGRIEDERCIAFVCISRAKELVRLSGYASQVGKSYQPSRFVAEALTNKGG